MASKSLDGKTFLKGKEGDGKYWFSNREPHGMMVAGILAQLAPKTKMLICCISDGGEFQSQAINRALEDLLEYETCQVVVMYISGKFHVEKEKRKRI